MHTLSDVELRRFLAIAKDDPFYLMYYVDFFTGLRESELIGLPWDCIDFAKGTIRVYRQFVRIASGPDKGKMMFTSLKNHKERTIHPAPSVMEALRQAKEKQNRQRLVAGSSWDNVYDMVFTRDNGMFIRFKTLYVHFKALVGKLNRPEVRFHDIRHTYATLAIQSEIDFKTLSLSLGQRLWVRCGYTAAQKKPKPLHLQGFRLVEHSGFEPLTPTLPVLCATSCANAPQHKIV